jgi:hypothetical protein
MLNYRTSILLQDHWPAWSLEFGDYGGKENEYKQRKGEEPPVETIGMLYGQSWVQ